MGIPFLPQGYRVQLLWSAQDGGRPWSTKFDYQALADFNPTAEAVANEFAAQLATSWVGTSTAGLKSNFASSTALQTIRVYSLGQPDVLFGFERAPTGTIAGGASTVLPAETAVVASLRTNVLGRRGRGRQYWGGLSNIAVSSASGAVRATFRTELVTFVDSFRELSVGAGTIRHVVISTAGFTGDRPTGASRDVTQVLVDAFPDTQRRRGGR
jgi:hypothetical protein